MPQSGDLTQILVPEARSKPFLLRNPRGPAEPIIAAETVVPAEPIIAAEAVVPAEAVATAAARLPRLDPFEVRLSGKLLRAQLRATLPARHR